MQKSRLGRSAIEVSRICLGSMTWGSQNSPEEGWAQIDRALERGVNFIDTAEMYPTTPRSQESQGRTEEIIGDWFQRSGRRGDVVLATKVVGAGYPWPREGAPITAASMREALEASLRRLKTDCVDLYQLHWPNRGSYHFRKAWTYDPYQQETTREQTRAEIEEILRTAGEFVREGKIRTIGLSNDTCWGTMQFLQIAEREELPRVVSIQNEYNLLYRNFDHDLAELSCYEDVGLLAYSPLAAGLLSGKYLSGDVPKGSRADVMPDLGGRRTGQETEAVAAYVKIAHDHDIDPATMAIAWGLSRPFMTSSIIGATDMAQLDSVLDAADLTLPETAMQEIQRVYRRYPMAI